MQLGMLGLGRMGANMARRLMQDGHACVVHDRVPGAIAALADVGATGAASLGDFVAALDRPRVAWLMVPAAAVDGVLDELVPLLDGGDTVIDGGNSHFRDDIRRARVLAGRHVHYIDVGVSGGVFGLERGYCQMIGGETEAVARLDTVFASLAPPHEAAAPTAGRERPGSTAGRGYLHCGSAGAGHFVKMVHNAIEYGLMAAYAEGFNLLTHADRDQPAAGAPDADTAPVVHEEAYRYAFDVGEIAELWRRGSVIGSWLLDLTALALSRSPRLEGYAGRVEDSGEGRWALETAVDLDTPAPVLATALFGRFGSRGESDFADRLLSALRHEFGGHAEKDPP